MTDTDVLREALAMACRELVAVRKYGGGLPDNAPPPTDAEAQEASRCYDRLFDQAAEALSGKGARR